MTFIPLPIRDLPLDKKEAVALSAIIAAVGILTALDVYEDCIDGAPLSHIIPEVLIIFFTVGVSMYLLRRLLRSRTDLLEASRAEMELAKLAAKSWQLRAEGLKKGISDAISSQFDDWGLSPAEKDVGFLLIKGLSIQEVANVRETSERTVRQQASELYRKSGLSGRAQLSAFFLEDLMGSL